MCFFFKYESSFKKKRLKQKIFSINSTCILVFELPPSGLRSPCASTFILHDHLFPFPLPLVHTWGFCESWPCCTVIGEEVKLFKKILKLFLLFLLCI